jgi:hypothetical protein
MRFLAFVFFSIFILSVEAQTTRFNRTYYNSGGDSSYVLDAIGTVIELTDGYFFPHFQWNYQTGTVPLSYTKTDKTGNIIWTIKYDIPNFQFSFFNITPSFDSNLVMCGRKANVSTEKVFSCIIKLNKNTGDTVWTKTFDPGYFKSNLNSIIETPDKGLICAGWVQNYSGSTPLPGQAYLLRTDSLGNKLWEKFYGVAGRGEEFMSMEKADTGYVLVGSSHPFDGTNNADGYIVKIDTSGNLKWTKNFVSPHYEYFTTSKRSFDGNFIVGGGKCLGPGVTENSEGYLLKISNLGTILWENTYGEGIEDDAFLDLVEATDSGIVAAGGTNHTPLGDQAGYVTKFDRNGNKLWSRIYNYEKFSSGTVDLFWSVIKTTDNGFLFAGQVGKGPSMNQDAWLVKTDSLGCDSIGCQLVFINEPANEKMEFSIFPNPVNYVLNVSLNNDNIQADDYEIMDLTGRLIVREKIYSNVFSVATLNLPQSLYSIIVLKNNKVLSRKLFSVIH